VASQSQTQFVMNPDHKKDAVRDLLRQFQNRPRIVALVEAIAEACQVQEEDTFSMIVSRSPSAAVGALLDQWGILVGEPRGGLTDDEYRPFIQARLLANRFPGDEAPEDAFIHILEIITEAVEVRTVDMFPAGFYCMVIRKEFMGDPLRDRVRRFAENIKPQGVKMVLVEALEGFFGFAETPGAFGYSVGTWARLI